MKLTRRKFFAGLAVAPLAAVGAIKALPALANNISTSLTKLRPLRHTTIKTSLPVATWRKLYSGIEPSFSANWWDTEEGMEAMNETNEILAELPWIESDGKN